MTTRSAAVAPILIVPSLRARVLGLGTVFGKTLRDSSRSALVLATLQVLIVATSAWGLASQFDTPLKRFSLAAEMAALPAVFEGMLGAPIHIDQLGGFLSWRVINFAPILFGIWSVVALSGVLAGELSRGSLELLAASPLARRRLALEKVLGYLAITGLAILLIALGTYASIAAFAALPGDAVGLDAVLAQHVWLWVATLVPGAIGFAVAPIVGRGIAVGLAAIVLFVSFATNAYAGLVPAFDAIRPISYLAFTANHRPMAGVWDWPPVLVLAAVVVALLAIGVVAFERRDLLVPSVGGRLPIPRIKAFVAGPLSRGIGERLPAALSWGVALAFFGAVIASSADEFVALMGNVPEITKLIQQILPGSDILSTGGFLQIALFQEAIVAVGLAAATFVAGWASDENERRLEVVLGAPMTRSGWAVKSAASVLVAIAVMTALLAAGILAGSLIAGGEVARPTIGIFVLGLYGMALAGIGLAVGGLVRPSLAAPVTAGLGIGFFLLDIIGSILRLPDPILDVALNRHLGRPIVGDFDPAGIILCAAIAVAGVALCAGGMERRDIGR